MTWVVVAWAAMVGSIFGSFLNVVIYRVPAGLSVVAPPSACPTCHSLIRACDNVPVLSWLILRGRCRTCREPISRRYPVVEALTAVLFAVVAFRFGLTTLDAWAIIPFWVLTGTGVALSAIDLDTHRLPDPITAFAYLAGGAGLLAASLAGAGDGPTALGRAGIGAAAVFTFHLLAWVIYPQGIGFGDVKLAGVTGMFLAWLGWGPLLVGVMASYLLGLLAIGALALIGRAPARGITFGPAMFAGAAVGIAAGQPIWAAYLHLMGL